MGEDRTTCSEKKNNGEVTTSSYPCRHRHSSVISSCSEDAESESTSAGYPPTPDEERDEELEYGPGIVNKLRCRFLSITLKQNSRGMNSMRRSCSMENLLDQDRPGRPFPSVEKATAVKPPLGNLKRAKSMDTLLMEMNPEDPGKVVKSGLMPTICDEELPKPDTVKTYKRMFEPAESRRGYHCRRPPVLRASARSNSGSKVNGVSPSNQSSAKVNGTSVTRNKYSAKQLSPLKAQSPDLSPTVNGKKSPESPKPLFNGCHVVKATPVKINNIRNGKEVENFNSINRLLNKKEVHFTPKTDHIICNGNVTHNDILEIKLNKDVVKQFTKNNMTNGNVKPKVPPNRPTLRSPRPLTKINEQPCNDLLSPTKAKPILSNGLNKICENNNKSDSLKSPEPKSPDVSKIPHQYPLKHIRSPPPVNKPKEDFVWPPELKSKDTLKNKSSNDNAGIKNLREKDTVTETIPVPEKKVKDIIQTLSESSVVKKETQQEKPPISKLPERTVMVSPDIPSDKLLKSPTVPPPKVSSSKQPTNITKEPAKTPSPVSVEPSKKPVNGIMDSSKNSVNGPTHPSNGFAETSKKSTSGSAVEIPLNNRTQSPCQPDKKSNGIADPSKKPVNGSVLDTPPNSTPSPSQVDKKPNGIPNPTKSPPSNGLPNRIKSPPPNPLPTTPVSKSGPAGKVSKAPDATDTKRANKPQDTVDTKRAIKKSPPQNTSMVFDFRGKDVVSHVAVLPTPFGCKPIQSKIKSENPEEDDEDEDYVDYSVPPPSGILFEGENIKIGKGSILAIRNKDLKITFDDDVDSNTFVYPSENSLLEDPEKSPTNEVIPNGQPPPNSKLKTNTSIGSSSSGGGLSSYTPSVLRTMDNFEPGMSVRPSPPPPPEKEVTSHQPESGKDEEEENAGVREGQESEDLKPADPDLISSWSISAGTSDLLF